MEEIGRKHPIHLDVHDRRDTPRIVFVAATPSSHEVKAALAARSLRKPERRQHPPRGEGAADTSADEGVAATLMRQSGSAIFGTRNCAGGRVTNRNGSMSSRIRFVRDWPRNQRIGHIKVN
jgi:hypothetical protein